MVVLPTILESESVENLEPLSPLPSRKRNIFLEQISEHGETASDAKKCHNQSGGEQQGRVNERLLTSSANWQHQKVLSRTRTTHASISLLLSGTECQETHDKDKLTCNRLSEHSTRIAQDDAKDHRGSHLPRSRVRIPTVHAPPADLWQVSSSEHIHPSPFLSSSFPIRPDTPTKLFGHVQESVHHHPDEPSDLPHFWPRSRPFTFEKNSPVSSATSSFGSEPEVSHLRSTLFMKEPPPRRPPPAKDVLFMSRLNFAPEQCRRSPRVELEHLVLQYMHNKYAPRTVSPLSPLRNPLHDPSWKNMPVAVKARAESTSVDSNYNRTVGDSPRRRSACERKRRDLRDESKHCIECRRDPLVKRLLAHNAHHVHNMAGSLSPVSDVTDNDDEYVDFQDDVFYPAVPRMETLHDFDMGDDVGDFFSLELDDGIMSSGSLF